MYKFKRVLILLVVMLVLMPYPKVYANSESNAETILFDTVSGGYYYSKVQGIAYNYTQNNYKLQDGAGYVYYQDLWKVSLDKNMSNTNTYTIEDGFFTEDFSRLTSDAERNFLSDLFGLADAMVYDTNFKKDNGVALTRYDVTQKDVDQLLREIQQSEDLSAVMLAAIMRNATPDLATASRYYSPFSGIVSTLLGTICVVVVVTLGFTIALDICYITLPAAQIMLDAEDEKGKVTGFGKMVSKAARRSIKETESNALSVYAKGKGKEIFLLSICLLYLICGKIFALIAGIVNLLSGVF